uniref:P-type Ca(2+) transporter n=1 Tax=Romanomermis culicivorax TaxID=13658 RepID=A0A915K0I2_ROMCU
MWYGCKSCRNEIKAVFKHTRVLYVSIFAYPASFRQKSKTILKMLPALHYMHWAGRRLNESLEQIDFRRRYFGQNVIPPKPPKTFFALIIEAMKDTTLIILIAAAVVSLGLSFYPKSHNNDVSSPVDNSDAKAEWIEGAAIFIAVVVVVMVTAGNNYSKEKQFRGLQSSIAQEQKFSTIRYSRTVQILVSELVVGDICQVKYGDLIPADGVVLQSNDLKLDEASLTGETDLVKKGPDSDPYVLSGTHVMEGSGKIVITAVGINSQTGIIMKLLGATKIQEKRRESMREAAAAKKNKVENGNVAVAAANDGGITVETNDSKKSKQDEEDEDDDEAHKKERSVLQAKLTHLATQIGYAGTVIAVLTVLALLIRSCITKYGINGEAFSIDDVHEWVGFVIIGITVLVIAVPEGLPLAVTLALAYSVKKMMRDHNLVRHLYACETMGNATAICSDKTGTLTTNTMTVVQSYIAETHFKEVPSDAAVPLSTKDLLVKSIAINSGYTSQVQPPKEPNGQPKQIGNKTECALLGFVVALGQSYQTVREENPEETFVKKCLRYWNNDHSALFNTEHG